MYSTELLEALNNVLKMELIEGHPKRVFLLTDGDVVNKNEVVALVRKYTQNTGTRVYTLGIGEGVSTSLIKGIASNGGGIAEFTQGNDDVKAKVMHLLKCAMQPSIRDIAVSLNLPPGVTYITIPTEFPPSISVGEKFTVYAILQGVVKDHSNGECFVTLEGCENGVPVSYKMTFTLGKGKDICTSAPVHRLATKAQIKLLEDKENIDWFELRLTADQTADQRQKIIAISCHGNIVSKYTAFVAIDTKGEKVKGRSQTRSCPVPLMTMDYMDGMYDLGLKQQGVTDPNMFAAAVRAHSVQRMKLTKNNCLFEEEKARKDSEPNYGFRMKKRFRFHVKLPKLGGLFSKLKKRLSSASNGSFNQAGATDRSLGAEGCSDSGVIGATVNLNTSYDKQSEEMLAVLLPDDEMIPAEKMMQVIELQLLLGQWEVSDLLFKLLDIDKEDFNKLNFSSDTTIVCTVVAVCWLRKWFPHRKDEWKMIEMKALTWLASQNLPSPTEDIIQQATLALWL